MNDEDASAASLADALAGLDHRVGPTESERARSRRRFESVLDRELGGTATTETSDLQGLPELPRLVEPPTSPTTARRILAAAAVVVLILGGVGVWASLADDTELDVRNPVPGSTSSTTSTTTVAPSTPLSPGVVGTVIEPGRYRVELGEQVVSFAVDQPVEVTVFTTAAVVLVPTTDSRGMGERVGIVAAQDLFDGQTPDDWIESLGVFSQVFRRSVDGVARSEWSISQTSDDCELFTVCPPLAASAPEVGVNAGGQTRVVPIIDSGAEPLALVATYQDQPVGPTADLYGSVVTTLDVER